MTAGPARGDGHADRDWFGLASFTPGRRFLQQGGRLYLLDEVGSTNDFLRGLGEPAAGRLCLWDGWGWRAQKKKTWPPVAQAQPGTVVAARRQTGGHGRQGRSWIDCGGLNLSVVIPPQRVPLARGFSVWLGLMTVLVLREVLRLDARLKWPNDLMVHERKLGGILLQRQMTADHSLTVAGLGLNLVTGPGDFPAALQGHATSVLLEVGRKVRPAVIAGSLVNRVEEELDRFRSEGWSAYHQALTHLDCLLGKEICIQTAKGQLSGRAAGIDDGGALRLETAAGRTEIIQAGEVHVLPLDEAGPQMGEQ